MLTTGELEQTSQPRRAALVTGAAQGIGRAVAELLGVDGTHVACLDRNAQGLSQTLQSLQSKGISASAHPVELGDRDAVRRAVHEIESQIGPVSQLACVAGIFRGGDVLSFAPEHLAELIDVNLCAVVHVLQATLPAMVERRAGSVVTVGSNAASTPRIGMAAYGASKAAATAFTLSMGLEVARFGVRCNVVSPGSTDTPMQRALWSTDDAPERVIRGDLAQARLGIALGRIAAPADVASVVAFLLSDQARHVTIQNITVDGGATF